MPDVHAVIGNPVHTGPGNRRVDGLVAVALVAFVVVAIAKPWGTPAPQTTSSPLPSASDLALRPNPSVTTTPVVPERPVADVEPLPIAFTTPAPPAGSATWTGLRWRKLEASDPLSLLTSVVHWRRGYVAVGWLPGLPATPVWTSSDGRQWQPLQFDNPTTFWPGSTVIGIAEVPSGLVALTEIVGYCGAPCAPTYELPVVSWTSTDGREWTPHVLPPEWLSSPTGAAPLFAAGPAGLVVASTGPGAHLATSTDGIHWRLLAGVAFPARFAVSDMRGTNDGYVAVGRWITSGRPGDAAAMWSSDGRRWSRTATQLPTSPASRASVGSAALALFSGRGGVIAVGRGVTNPRASLWWQSVDGQRWHLVDGFRPLGVRAGAASPASQPDGPLTGDGDRLLAMRGGADPAAWISQDELAWRRIGMSGDLPSGQATRLTMLPGGVLVSDGITGWFGEAVTR